MRVTGNIMVAALLCGLAGTSVARSAGETIVKERQHAMKAMAEASKTVSGMFEGRRLCSGEALKAAAEAIRAARAHH